VAQGVPFARDYGGYLANRSFGGAQVSRTFYAKGQTGQQLLLGAYSALMRQVKLGKVKIFPRTEMHDLVIIDGKARGIITRDLITGKIEKHFAHAVVIASGGYGNTYFLSTMAMGANVSAAWQSYKRGAYFGNPSFVQIHPTCIPVHGDYQSKLTLMSESLRNDGRIWVPKNKEDVDKIRKGELKAGRYPGRRKGLLSGKKIPGFRKPCPSRCCLSELPKKDAMPDMGLVIPDWLFTSIFRMLLNVLEGIQLKKSTGIFFRCTRKLWMIILMKPQ
jgi:succinate dehydrogenase / fumarate reductase, flavoprotein subunit